VKVTSFQLFKWAFAVAAGYELGRTIPVGLIQALNKKNRAEIKKRYREGVKEAEKNGRAVRLVQDTETPTGG